MRFQSDKTAETTGDWFKKTLATAIVVLAFSVGPSAGQVDAECGKAQIPFPNITDSIDYFTRCSFPIDQLNSNCMMSSCPDLTGLSPVNADNSVDPTILAQLCGVLNDCLAKNPNICGITMASTPMVYTGWGLNNLFNSSLKINGSCLLNANSGNIDNLNRVKISAPPSQQNTNGKIILSLSAPNVTQSSSWNCYMSIPSNLIDPSQTGSIEVFHFPNMMATLNIAVNATFAIDFTASPPTFTVISNNPTISVNLFNFKSCSMNLPQALVDAINLSINGYFKTAPTTASVINFQSTFATQGVAAAIQSCR